MYGYILSWLMSRMTTSMIYWYQRKHLGCVSFKEWECLGPDLIKHGALTHEKQLSSAPLLIK